MNSSQEFLRHGIYTRIYTHAWNWNYLVSYDKFMSGKTFYKNVNKKNGLELQSAYGGNLEALC